MRHKHTLGEPFQGIGRLASDVPVPAIITMQTCECGAIFVKSPQKKKTKFLRKKDLPKRSETHVYCLNKQGFFKIDPPRMRTTGLILCTGCGQPIYSHTHEDAYEPN